MEKIIKQYHEIAELYLGLGMLNMAEFYNKKAKELLNQKTIQL